MVAAHDCYRAASIHRSVGQQLAGTGVGGHFQAILRQAHTQAEGQTGSELPAFIVASDEDDVGLHFACQDLHRREIQVWVIIAQRGIGYGVGAVGPMSNSLLRHVSHVSADQSDGKFLAESVGQCAAGGEQFLGGRAQFAGHGVAKY